MHDESTRAEEGREHDRDDRTEHRNRALVRGSPKPRTKRSKFGTALGAFSIALGVAEIAAPRLVLRIVGARPTKRSVLTTRLAGIREVVTGVGMIVQPNRSEWAWARVVGDFMDFAALSYAGSTQMRGVKRLRVASNTIAAIAALDIARSTQLRPRIKPRVAKMFGDAAVDIPLETERPMPVERAADAKRSARSAHEQRDAWYNHELANERSTF